MTQHGPYQADIIWQAVQAAVSKAAASTERVGANINERVGACLFDTDTSSDNLIAHANVVPAALSARFDNTQRMGKSSIYLHSEVAAILASDRPTQGMAIAVTTPPCPNCAKMIAEAGITHVFQYREGLRGAFATERKHDVRDMSLEVFKRAGIQVSIVDLKNKKIRPQALKTQLPAPPSAGFQLLDIGADQALHTMMSATEALYDSQAYAIARVTIPDDSGPQDQVLLALESLPPGLTPQRYQQAQKAEGKYRFVIDPVNRLLMHAKRYGYDIERGHIVCSMHPASRALVNAVAAGVERITFLRDKPDHGEDGPSAAKLLNDKHIMQIHQASLTPQRPDDTIPPEPRHQPR